MRLDIAAEQFASRGKYMPLLDQTYLFRRARQTSHLGLPDMMRRKQFPLSSEYDVTGRNRDIHNKIAAYVIQELMKGEVGKYFGRDDVPSAVWYKRVHDVVHPGITPQIEDWVISRYGLKKDLHHLSAVLTILSGDPRNFLDHQVYGRTWSIKDLAEADGADMSMLFSLANSGSDKIRHQILRLADDISGMQLCSSYDPLILRPMLAGHIGSFRDGIKIKNIQGEDVPVITTTPAVNIALKYMEDYKYFINIKLRQEREVILSEILISTKFNRLAREQKSFNFYNLLLALANPDFSAEDPFIQTDKSVTEKLDRSKNPYVSQVADIMKSVITDRGPQGCLITSTHFSDEGVRETVKNITGKENPEIQADSTETFFSRLLKTLKSPEQTRQFVEIYRAELGVSDEPVKRRYATAGYFDWPAEYYPILVMKNGQPQTEVLSPGATVIGFTAHQNTPGKLLIEALDRALMKTIGTGYYDIRGERNVFVIDPRFI